jgi:hypothetical protein
MDQDGRRARELSDGRCLFSRCLRTAMWKHRVEIEGRVRNHKKRDHCRDYHCSDQKRPSGTATEQCIAKVALKTHHAFYPPTSGATRYAPDQPSLRWRRFILGVVCDALEATQDGCVALPVIDLDDICQDGRSSALEFLYRDRLVITSSRRSHGLVWHGPDATTVSNGNSCAERPRGAYARSPNGIKRPTS